MAETTTFICARCGVNAFPTGTRSISKNSLHPLDLCGHHTDEHRQALTKAGWTIVALTVLVENQRLGAEA